LTPLKGLKNSRVRGSLISTGFPRISGEAGGNHNRTDSCRKREAELDIVRSFVLVFCDSRLGDAVPLIEPSHPIGQANIRAWILNLHGAGIGSRSRTLPRRVPSYNVFPQARKLVVGASLVPMRLAALPSNFSQTETAP
jgi:hypothetical protein